MQFETQSETNISFESRDNVMASAKYGNDASEALYAASYASSPAAQTTRSLKREQCDGINAIKAAIALDERRLPDALQLLQDCATAASALSHGRNRLENFVRGVNGNERNGSGFDLDYSDGGSGYDKSFVDGFEIK